VDQLNSFRLGVLATPTAFSESDRDRVQSPDSARDKLAALLSALGVKPTSDFRMCELAITWRNRLVHNQESDRKLNSALKRNLIAFDEEIRAKHRGLNVSECIAAYDQGGAPTLKAVASFVQAAQDLATALDHATVQRVSPEGFVEDAIRTWVSERGGTHALTKTWGGPAEQTRRRVLQLLISAGMHEVEPTHPQALDAAYLHGLLNLSASDAKARFHAVDVGGIG
jgi:hypothetical protein